MGDATKIVETGVLPEILVSGGGWDSKITRQNTASLYDENHKYGIDIKAEITGSAMDCSRYGFLRPQLLSGEGHVVYVPELDVDIFYGLVNVEKGLTVINGTSKELRPYFISTLSQAVNSESPTGTAPTSEIETWSVTFGIPSGGAMILDTAGGGTAFMVIEAH